MKKILFFTVLLISLYIIKNLAESIYSLWQKQELLVSAQKELEREKQKHRELQTRVKIVESDDFLEEQARNKLFLVKEGEHEVIIPKSVLEASLGAKMASAAPLPTWKQWFALFW